MLMHGSAGKRRRGNPEALARLAKRAKPAAYDDDNEPVAKLKARLHFSGPCICFAGAVHVSVPDADSRGNAHCGLNVSAVDAWRCLQQADEDEEYGAAQRKSQQFLASVTGQFKQQQPASHAADGFYGGQAAAKPKPVKRPPPPPVTQTKSFKPQGGSDDVLRGKVRRRQ